MNFFTPSNDRCFIFKKYGAAKGEEKAALKGNYDAHIKRKKREPIMTRLL